MMRSEAKPNAKPYPWHALTRLTRAQVETVERARRQLSPAVSSSANVTALTRALARWLRCPTAVRVEEVTTATYRLNPLNGSGVEIALRTGTEDEGALVLVVLENAMALRVLAEILGRESPPVDPSPRPPPELTGSMGAFAVLVARRLGTSWQLAAPPPEGTPLAVIKGVVRLGDDNFSAVLSVPLAPVPPPRLPFDRTALLRLGNLPISLPLVASVAAATRDDLEALTVGSAWVPEDDEEAIAWLQRDDAGQEWRGQGLLMAPASEVGLSVTVAPATSTRRKSGLQLTLAEAPVFSSWESTEDDEETGTAHVIRMEIGHVTLPARRWATVAVGDALPFRWNLQRRIHLRASGDVFAAGELQAIEGRAAVRVTSRATAHGRTDP